MDICVSTKKLEHTRTLIEEYQKCKEDPIYFIDTYITVMHPIRGDHAFGLMEFQKDILRMIIRSSGKAGVANVARQMGLSHITAGFTVWHLIFKNRENVLSIHPNMVQAQAFTADVVRKLAHLPPFLTIDAVISYTKDTVRLANGSMLKSCTLTKNVGMGMSISTVFLHNVDTYRTKKQQADFIDTAFYAAPGLIRNGKVIFTTSGIIAGEIGDLILQCRDDAEHEYIEVPWSAHPERDEEWRDHMMSICSADSFAREFECKFIAGDTSEQ